MRLSLLVLALLAACGTDSRRSSDEDPSGTDGGTSDGGTSDGGTTDGGTTDGGAASATIRIVRLATDVTKAKPGQAIVFDAVVAASEGAPAVASGVLEDPGGGTYGSFASTAPGAWAFTLAWTKLEATRDVTQPSNAKRAFSAVFYDTAGGSAKATVEVALACTDPTRPICGGTCASSSTIRVCGDACVDGWSDRKNCGGCGNDCDVWKGAHTVGDAAARDVACISEACVGLFDVPTTDATMSCAKACQQAGLTCANSLACQANRRSDFVLNDGSRSGGQAGICGVTIGCSGPGVGYCSTTISSLKPLSSGGFTCPPDGWDGASCACQ